MEQIYMMEAFDEISSHQSVNQTSLSTFSIIRMFTIKGYFYRYLMKQICVNRFNWPN